MFNPKMFVQNRLRRLRRRRGHSGDTRVAAALRPSTRLAEGTRTGNRQASWYDTILL